MLVPIDSVVTFTAGTHNPATGAVTDADSTPTYDVFSGTNDTPILASQSMTKRGSFTGTYRGTFTASAANGFTAGAWINVVTRATVSGVSAIIPDVLMRMAPAESQSGVPKIDLAYTLGTASAGAAGSVRADAVTGAVGSVTGAVGSVTGAVGSVTGNVGGNVVGSVGSVSAGVALTSSERNSVADALLDRDMSTGTDSGSPSVRTVRQALRFLRNFWSISGGTLTVKKEDDSTTSWTGTVTQTAGNPVSSIDPA